MSSVFQLILIAFLAVWPALVSAKSCLQSGRYEYSMQVLSQQESLGIISYNLENLSYKATREKNSTHSEKVDGLVDSIHRIEQDVFGVQADLIMAQELIGIHSGTTFAQKALKSFDAKMFAAHHSRGIQTGHFVNKGRTYSYEARSHSDAQWTDPVTGGKAILFHKGVGSLIVRPEGASRATPPLFIAISLHLKSMRDRTGDPRSEIKRSTQVRYLVENIIAGHRKEFGEHVPIIVGGDTNAHMRAPELEPIRKAGFVDVFDAVGLAKPDRSTHVYFGENPRGEGHQLDKIYVSQVLGSAVYLAGVQRYREQLPKTPEERSLQPSDHYPVYVQFEMKKLMSRYRNAYQKGRWD